MTKLSAASKRLLATAVVTIALPIGANAQEACSKYTVKAGDSLGSIALAAYGSYDYQIIFNANRETLAGNPNNLTEGLELALPCEDGRLSADQDLAASLQEKEQAAATTKKKSNSYQPPLKFVTGNGWAPFTSKDLEGGGILTRIATTALQRGGNDRESKVGWVDDWQSHIDVLLPSGAFDISIAWEQPDCSKLDILSEESVKRCTDFDFSLPIYEVAQSFFTLNDNKYVDAKSFTEYQGAKICRPAAWGSADLEVEGLVAPFIEMVRPKDPIDCANLLLEGKVDVYSIELETATANFEELGASDKVTLNPYNAKFTSYQLMTSKTNPRGRVYLSMLNKGIAEMRESGEWYDIVATGLAEYNKLGQ
ncbi:transporter substrate-binding domain-containing protein [Frigidibacter sp. RF13]|uniref:transporter substrate-binding domain-containing protein n=1 Tax=Frigidibacter sp. RF13 TaxID=2997340 RepID=UPI002271FF20|nr:transporter substrate-binding domain-containing protein [Frigidibacter sp. RF13]MCY1128271.1 transporter substrate-binding domain-containing protein [Frigidibacter sp. RF13]